MAYKQLLTAEPNIFLSKFSILDLIFSILISIKEKKVKNSLFLKKI
jgi:hypothetical protein